MRVKGLAQIFSKHWGLLTEWKTIRKESDIETFCTATDGNHGKSKERRLEN